MADGRSECLLLMLDYLFFFSFFFFLESDLFFFPFYSCALPKSGSPHSRVYHHSRLLSLSRSLLFLLSRLAAVPPTAAYA